MFQPPAVCRPIKVLDRLPPEHFPLWDKIDSYACQDIWCDSVVIDTFYWHIKNYARFIRNGPGDYTVEVTQDIIEQGGDPGCPEECPTVTPSP